MNRLFLYIYRFLYAWVRVFYENDTLLTVSGAGILFFGLLFNYISDTSLANYILVFTGGFALLIFAAMLSSNYAYRLLWRALIQQMMKFEFTNLYYLDRDNLLEKWREEKNFNLILDLESLVNLVYPHYRGDYLRANADFLIKLLSHDFLSGVNRGILVENYFSIYSRTQGTFEPHQVEVFLKVLDISQPFIFKDGVERFFNLFSNFEIRKKMSERGWHHQWMYSFLGPEYYHYEVPPYRLVPLMEFNQWFVQNLGRKPALKKIFIEKIVNKDKKTVKWAYFKYLQAQAIFKFNYDFLLKEILHSLDRAELTPFNCPFLFSSEHLITDFPESIAYLKKHYGDAKLIKLLKRIQNEEELKKVLELIKECLQQNHPPQLPIKIRDWSQLVEFAQEEKKKSQQPDFSLAQYEIYNWENQQILNYTIWIPRRNYKLIRGATEMHNCVGNGEYSRRVLNKHSLIFFLKKGLKTQVCVELKRDDLHIRSIKGLYNNDVPAGVTDAVQAFINSKK